MKKTLTVLIILFTRSMSYGQVQSYFSSSGEMIFSFARIEQNGREVQSNLRWSPFFNWQGLVNHNFNQVSGLFYGVALRNVGFIYDIPNSDSLKKYRTYNVGFPVGLKLGNMKGNFIWGGYEFEMPFVYKEKTFVNERKIDVFEVWFSKRYNPYLNSVFFGINFKGGYNLKFKYYLDNFFNKDYTETANGVATKPFANFSANVFYIALDWNVFQDMREYSKQRDGMKRNAKPRQQISTRNNTSIYYY